MKARKKPHLRCANCRMRNEICICPEIEKTRRLLERVQTRVVIIMHKQERFSTTNTGHLAANVLPDCKVIIRGQPGVSVEPQVAIDSESIPLLLYPTVDAQVLNQSILNEVKKPITLIVPDGSWRQASKVSKREPFLEKVKRVTLPQGAPSGYALRREPKENGLATFEAIARCIGIIDGEAFQREMEKLFDLMVLRTLRSRAGLLTDTLNCKLVV